MWEFIKSILKKALIGLLAYIVKELVIHVIKKFTTKKPFKNFSLGHNLVTENKMVIDDIKIVKVTI